MKKYTDEQLFIKFCEKFHIGIHKQVIDDEYGKRTCYTLMDLNANDGQSLFFENGKFTYTV